ncbi:MAG: hypothetical protein HYR68_05110 [Burkholderiales bacterium]|nr:hypothetical protein [Burkholderiales bacterium]MBI3729964.1 hypothetical protein [Burkholderiales bacterium]
MLSKLKCLLLASTLYLLSSPVVQAQELTHLGVPAARMIAINGNKSFYGGGIAQWSVWQGGQLPPGATSSYSVPNGYSLVILEIETIQYPLALAGTATLYLSPPGQVNSGIVTLARVPLEASTGYPMKTQLLAAGIRVPSGYGMFWSAYVPPNGGNAALSWIMRGYLVKE